MSHRSVFRANVTKVAFIRSPPAVAGGRPVGVYGVLGDVVAPVACGCAVSATLALWEAPHFDFCSLMMSVALGRDARGIEDEEIK